MSQAVDKKLADLLAPYEARYVMVCLDCRTVLCRKKDSSYVKRARDEDRELGCSCGGEYELVRDRKPN